ncbi:MAG: nucleotide exchange factor GrpE [bacterium]
MRIPVYGPGDIIYNGAEMLWDDTPEPKEDRALKEESMTDSSKETIEQEKQKEAQARNDEAREEQNIAPESKPEPAGESTEDYKEKWMRALAEIENVRKRNARMMERMRQNERDSVLRAFLEIEDNLDRALSHEPEEPNPWFEGMQAIRDQMLGTLESLGVRPFHAGGELFDMHRHDAVARVQNSEVPEGTVLEETQKGYEKKDGEILRPAKVVVSHQ